MISAEVYPASSASIPPAPTALERLVARLHRTAVAPRGYRFVANIDVVDFTRAVRTVGQVAVAGELRLITPAVDDAGNPVPDVALYVRDHLPEPEEFWHAFQLLCDRHAA